MTNNEISTPSRYPILICFTANQPHSTGYYDANNNGKKSIYIPQSFFIPLLLFIYCHFAIEDGVWIFSGEGQNRTLALYLHLKELFLTREI